MSTILQAILCYLYDEKAFEKAGRVMSRESYDSRFCRHKNEVHLLSENQLWSNKTSVNAEWLHLVGSFLPESTSFEFRRLLEIPWIGS